jgi:hypothetical protein
MKKPAKAAHKKVVKNKKPQKPQQKAVKHALKKAAPAKVKPKLKVKIKPKVNVKAKINNPIKNKMHNKKVAAKNAPKKIVAPKKKIAPKAKVHAQVFDKKKAPQSKMEVMNNKNKKNSLSPKEAALKAKEASKLALIAEKENAKKLKLEEKENAKEALRLEKESAKKLKSKGKSKNSDFSDEEEVDSKPRMEDEDDLDDDFSDDKPVKVKMTFDEEFEEEIPVKKKKTSIDDNIKDSLAEEILALSEEFNINDVFASIRSMDLFKLDNDECVVRGCDNPSTTNGYCRYHYLKLWKDVKKKEQILQEGKLAKIIEDLVRKYPMKYIEAIVQDLADDKSFNHVLKDLDIETEEADLENFDDEDLLDDDQDIAFETKVVKPSFDD